MKSWRSCRAVLGALVQEAARDRRGSVAVVIGFVMVALVGMLALAVDVSAAVSAHAQLRQAADTAALAAVRQAAIDTQSDANASLAAATTAGMQRFMAQAGAIPRVAPSQPVVTVSRSGLVITAVVTFNTSYTTQIAGGLNAISPNYGSVASIPLGGSVAAQQQVGAHLDLQVLMDVSNSMTIGSTQAAQSALKQDTTTYPVHESTSNHQNTSYGWIQNGALDGGPAWAHCAFACHLTLHDGWTQQYGGYYQMAKQLGVQLRIDLLRGAAQQIATAMNNSSNSGNFRFSLNTFDQSQRVIYSLGSAGNASGAIASVDVTPIDIYGNYPEVRWPNAGFGDYTQTNVGPSIMDFANSVGSAGDGSSSVTAQKDIVILTDGIEDYSKSGLRQTNTFNSSACDALKAKGARVFVLHATSLANFIGDSNNPDPQATFNATVAAMKQCVSDPSYYFLASEPAEVTAATQAIINLALAQAAVITVPPSSFQTSSTSTSTEEVKKSD